MSNTVQKIQASPTNTFGLMATPAVDLTPTGHLPYLVAQADTAPIRAEAEQILAQCCQRRPDRDPATGYLLSGVEDTDETSLDRLLCVEDHGHDGDHRDAMRRTWTRTVQAAEQPRTRAEQTERLIAALPNAVDEAMRKAVPDKYTAEQADAFATCMIAELRRAADSPLTAAQRTPALDEGLGAHITAPVETALRDIDDQCSARENETLPFLAAQMVVSDYRPQAYGRHTHVWLHYGRTVGTLTPARGRQVLAAMRAFTDLLEAVVDLAEETAAGDFEGDPEIARLDAEYEARRIAAINKAHATKP